MKTQPYHIVRNSKIHGKGVFSLRPIRKGAKVIEYTGDIISMDDADEIGIQTVDGHSHTMLFTIDDERVINGNTGGDAKYINHSCSPNCETVLYGDKVFIEALRSIPKGEELTYDYHLIVEEKLTDKVLKEFACFCGSVNCRGSQIDPDILEKAAKKKSKKEEKKRKEKEEKAARKAEKLKKKEAKRLKKLKEKNGSGVLNPKKDKKGKKKKKNKAEVN